MKKRTNVMLCGILLLALCIHVTACGSSEDNNDSVPTDTVADSTDITDEDLDDSATFVAEDSTEETSPPVKYATVRYRNPVSQCEGVAGGAAFEYHALEYWETSEYGYEESEDLYLTENMNGYLIFASSQQAENYCNEYDGKQSGCVVQISVEMPDDYDSYMSDIREDELLIVYDEIVDPASMADEIAAVGVETCTTYNRVDTYNVYRYDEITGGLVSIDTWTFLWNGELLDDQLQVIELFQEQMGEDYWYEIVLDGSWLHEHFECGESYDACYNFPMTATFTRNSIVPSANYEVYDGEYLPFLDE